MPESIGSLFPTQVPSYTEAADIRKAFNLYHYGTEEVPTNESQILADSMAGYIRDTLAAIDAVVAGAAAISNLGASENINDLTQTGVYHSTTSPTALLNYPSTSIGLLNFWLSSSNNTYFQTYITNASASGSNFYWRTGLKVQATITWGEWQQAAKTGHTHDDRYYTIGAINLKIDTALSANSATYVDANGKIVSLATVTPTELGHLDGVTSGIQGQLDGKSATGHTHTDYWLKTETAKVTVSSTAPLSPAPGDLWFW